jgi:hypothetical protein
MTERQGSYVRTEVGVEGRLRPNRRTDGASKKSGVGVKRMDTRTVNRHR